MIQFAPNLTFHEGGAFSGNIFLFMCIHLAHLFLIYNLESKKLPKVKTIRNTKPQSSINKIEFNLTIFQTMLYQKQTNCCSRVGKVRKYQVLFTFF